MNKQRSIEQLDAIVERMESGELSLDESLKLFEKGVKLTTNCQKSLNEAEQKIKILSNMDDDNAKLSAYDSEN